MQVRSWSVNVLEQQTITASAPQHPDATSGLAARHSRRARWESLSVSAVVLCVVGAATLGLWMSSRNSAYIGYRHYLISLAREASASVDPQLHNQIRRPEQLNDSDYVRAVEPLRRIRRAVPDIHYIYTLVQSGNQAHFVLDAADPTGRTSAGLPDQSGVWDVYAHTTPEQDLAFGDGVRPGVPAASFEPVTDEWGTFMTGFAPLRDAAGASDRDTRSGR